MMRRQESYLGCGQMLVAVPAGGRWAHPSQALPVSLFSVAEKATDGVRRFHSGPNAASSVLPVFSHPSLRATCQGNMQAMPGLSPPPPQGSTAYSEGSPCLSISHKHSTASQWMWASPAYLLWSPVWAEAFLSSDKTCPLKVSQQCLKLPRLQASCKQQIFY